MKTNNMILLLAAQVLTAFSSPSPAAVNDDCGSGGGIDTSQLPEGVDPSAVRKCLEHPLGNINSEAVSERGVGLFERDCWHGKPVGCTKGYCWKTCGDGPWCWAARNDGFGDWYTCSKDSDCKASFPCSQKVGGDCDSCGCSC
ncbi:hypothetical protein F5Y04DRAFT_292595 [Hypomontagnella monticulosa]|nr:hypothetical protein F5Y04DRAFT_292595 [Hypomontagnella monticulosa]